MKRNYIAIFCLTALLFACGVDREMVPNQQKSFESYFSGKNYTVEDGVYRFIVNADRDGYDDQPVLWTGDSAYYYYAMYTFSSGPGALCSTNKFYLVEKDTIINTRYWSFDPIGVSLGNTQLMSGLERGLPGCRQGDSVVLLITSDLAYDNKAAGAVPAKTPLMMILGIQTVKKQ